MAHNDPFCNTIYQMNPLTYWIRNQLKKVNWVWSLGQNLGQIRSNVMKKKQRNWYFKINGIFFIFFLRYTCRSKKQSGYKYPSLSKLFKVKILFREFHFWAFSGPKCGPRVGQKWQKRLFSNPVFPKKKFLRTMVSHTKS